MVENLRTLTHTILHAECMDGQGGDSVLLSPEAPATKPRSSKSKSLTLGLGWLSVFSEDSTHDGLRGRVAGRAIIFVKTYIVFVRRTICGGLWVPKFSTWAISHTSWERKLWMPNTPAPPLSPLLLQLRMERARPLGALAGHRPAHGQGADGDRVQGLEARQGHVELSSVLKIH